MASFSLSLRSSLDSSVKLAAYLERLIDGIGGVGSCFLLPFVSNLFQSLVSASVGIDIDIDEQI